LSDEQDRRAEGPLVEDYTGERARVYGAERAVLVAVETPKAPVDDALRELSSLARTAGVEPLGEMIQARNRPDPSTFIGKGKVDELKAAAEELGADVVLFNEELSPAQGRNLEEILGRKVIDRTQLILDIFAQRAATKEARIQVELAQLRYLLPRLRGWGEALSRLGGGIGTRGPGETKLEVDRDKINRRIHALERQLVKAEAERRIQRKHRTASPLPKIVLVGYTNSGKSTLLNRLCESDALVEDKLFATLATSVRRGDLGEGRTGLFIDTVGFIRDLPHHLIPAFASTLEAAREADLLLHLVDLASPAAEEEHRTVLFTLDREVFQTDGARPPTIDALNKVDLDLARGRTDLSFVDGVRISAQEGTGIDLLLDRIRSVLSKEKKRFLVPYSAGPLVRRLAARGQVTVLGYRESGIEIESALCPEDVARLIPPTETGSSPSSAE
jgi:GTP-binding protein HflX